MWFRFLTRARKPQTLNGRRATEDPEIAALNVGRDLSLEELEGLGAAVWDGIDAQVYVNELHREWDHRP